MTLQYIVCDRCAASVPEASGALVLRYGGYPQMNLCESCIKEVFDRKIELVVKLKGNEEKQHDESEVQG